MKLCIKDHFNNFKGYNFFVSDALKEHINSDKQKLAEITALVAVSLKTGEWGYIDNNSRKENRKTLLKNYGWIVAEYLYNYVPIFVFCHTGDKTVEVYLAEEIH